MLGSRGIPANYSGYETMIEALAPRLAERGWRVTVYCRSHYVDRRLRSHRGVELVVLPTLRTKYGDTPVHTLLSCLHATLFARGARAALVVNGANAVFLPLLWPRRIRTALHVDGIEKRRAKWGWPGRLVYAASERLACLLPGVTVTDADVIAAHYRARYRRESTMIRYGVEPEPLPGHPVLDELGLEPRGYFLYVSRFEPENNPHRVVAAYRKVGGDLPLVMVGDAPYASDFIAAMKRGADPRVRFPGTVFGEGYRGLLSSAAGDGPRHRGRRHAPGAGRGDGLRQLRTGQRRTGQPRNGRRRGRLLQGRGRGLAGRRLRVRPRRSAAGPRPRQAGGAPRGRGVQLGPRGGPVRGALPASLEPLGTCAGRARIPASFREPESCSSSAFAYRRP